MEDMQNKFHSLGGESAAEHKQQFNAFANELRNAGDERQVREFVNAMVVRNRQEKNFRALLLLQHGTVDDWWRTLQEQDRISARIILKSVNILKLFNGISAQKFIFNICPHISYVVRINLINKLARCLKDENLGEEYFKAVHDRYGLRIATSLLATCSSQFIKETCIAHKINFGDRQLIQIYKKCKELIPFYFTQLSKYDPECFKSRDLLARFLSVQDAQTFWSLTSYGFPKIGKKGKMNIIKTYKDELIKNPKRIQELAKPKLVNRCLNRDDYHAFFMKLFPKSVDNINFWDYFGECLRVYPREHRYEKLRSGFKETYKYDFDLNSVQAPPNFFSLEAQRKVIKNLDEYDIEKIKSLIKGTQDFKARSDLLVMLLETCRLYDDYDSLLEVLKYFLARHKNEIIEVRKRFLDYIDQNFQLTKFTEEHWAIVFQLISTFELQEQFYYNKCYYLKDYVQYKQKLGLNYDKELRECIKIAGIYTMEIFDREYAYDCYMKYPNFLMEVFAEDLEQALVNYVFLVRQWNEKPENRKIPIYNFPNIVDGLMKIDNYYNPYFHQSLISELFNHVPISSAEKKYQVETLEKFAIKHSYYFKTHMCMWFFNNSMEVFERNIDLFLETAGYHFYYKIIKMHYHPLYKKCKERALNGLNGSKDEKCFALKFLSYEEDYLSIIEEYSINYEDVIDLKDEGEKELAEIRGTILRSLKNYGAPEKCLDYTVRFCRRDYLRYALEALYFTTYNSPESMIEAPISELLTRAVSVRKHTIHLATSLYDIKRVTSLIADLINTEENKSVRFYLLKRTLKCLRGEGSDEFWELFKLQIQNVQSKDCSTMRVMMSFNSISRKYLDEYIRLLWNILTKANPNWNIRVLNAIKPHIFEFISLDFFKDAINSVGFNTATNDFVCNFLLSNCDSLDERLEITFMYIKKAVEIDFATALTTQVIKKLSEFVQTVIKKLLLNPQKSSVLLLEKFIANFKKINTPFNKTKFVLSLEFAMKYIDNPENLVPYLATKQEQMVKEADSREVIDYYRKNVIYLLNILFSETPDDNFIYMLKLCEELVQLNQSDDILLLIIDLLPVNATTDIVFKNRRQEIIAMCKANVKNDEVQLYLTDFLINLNI